MKIVLFDFCETLVDFQTADAYVDYVREHLHSVQVDRRESLNRIIRKTKLTSYFDSFTRYKYSLEKRIKLYQLRGIQDSVLEHLAESYYEECIKPHLITVTNKILRDYQNSGYKIWIISGGYSIYLKHYAKENRVEFISSNLEFRNGVCTGCMAGLDCMNSNKVTLLKKKLDLANSLIVASYSDSISDIPILSIAETGYVVTRSSQSWAGQYSFKEVIW